jgi:putative tryptophan/tyrosine transport system substrate-binding protein
LNLNHAIFKLAPRRLIIGGLVFLLLLPPFANGANNLRVLVVLSEISAPYQAFAKTFQQNLTSNFQVSVLQNPEDFSPGDDRADLIITVGIKATDSIASKTAAPLIAVMVPNTGYLDLLKKQNISRRISAIYIDQPWARQVALLNAALPEARSVGLLYSAESRINLQALHHELERHGHKLVARLTHGKDSLSSDLEDVIAQSDVLLAIPDGNIYNSNNIRDILLTSYRQHIPLVGLSQSYVNAGALCAIFSTPEQIAAQASMTAILFAQTRHLPEPQSPELFTIAVNRDVARTLDVTPGSAEMLHMQIEKILGAP